MNQRILVATAAYVVVAALLAGCGSSLISRVDREDSGTGFARYVMKRSESQNIIRDQEFLGQPSDGGTFWMVNRRHLEEVVSASGAPGFREIGDALYIRLDGRTCYTRQLVAWGTIKTVLLPPGAQIDRVADGTIYFGTDLAPGTRDVALPLEHGFLRFGNDDLVSSRVVKFSHTPARFVENLSYPKQLPSGFSINAPTNVCKG